MSEVDDLKEIDEFETHYQYDGTYLRELLALSPDGYAKFAAFRPLAYYQGSLDKETFWIAKLATMQVEDCGECLQLNVRFALENGIAREIIEAVLQGGDGLSEELRDLYDFAVQVASSRDLDPALEERIQSRLSRTALLDLGVCIASAKVFPTIKRAAGYANSCRLIEIQV
ncbi:Carboxymuconolactone decarboxylase family protein [Gimesia alba]|uniref:Carboxymuconolactone decarboxylase family protein n=1 Tax=Gimesia alba TaxID=2527973 RepID=A0A517R9K9_9PLAN|nr:carboxymuconolactone decarboxylase family protein [Gimesia alba]QDT40579.1 Carboxymuconolactone decarboxylase family protein [Gimesia alba]